MIGIVFRINHLWNIRKIKRLLDNVRIGYLQRPPETIDRLLFFLTLYKLNPGILVWL